MLDEAKILDSRVEFYKQDIDNPFSVNGFRGTWQFSDHSLIPSTLHGFLTRYFGIGKLKRIPLAEINKLMNDVWDGPGSLEKIFRLEHEMRLSGKTIKFDSRDFAKSKKDEEEEEDFEGLDLPLNAFGSDDFDDTESEED